jgi:hypothetical protein
MECIIMDQLQLVLDRLDRIETAIATLAEKDQVKEWYSTGDVAKLLNKAEFTVREWCRLKRIDARKRQCGRGQSQEWMIAHAELLRIQNEGLLPAKD